MIAADGVNVTTDVPLPGAARLALEKDAVTPAGRPVKLSAMVELKAPDNWLAKLTCAVEPALRVRVVCVGVMAKVDGAVRVSGTAMVCVKPVPAAVRDRLAVPVLAVLAAVKVSVVVEPAVSVAGLTCVVTPVGRPAIAKLSGALKVPCVTVHESFVVVDWPTVRLTAEEVAAKVQSGGGATVNGTVIVFVKPLPAAVNCSW